MKQELRIDRGTLRKPEKTPQGFLRVDGWIGRAGIYEYYNTAEDEKNGYGKKGTLRRELRTDEVVFAASALEGFRSMPITLGHPGKVTPANVKAVQVGDVDGPAWRDDAADRAAATLVIKDATAIKKAESGRLELSPGYLIHYVHKPGVDPKYGRYDGIQTNITPNHLALVDRARGGSDLKLRLDGEEIRGDGHKLTSIAAGHQHLIDTQQPSNSYYSQETSWAVSAGADNGHAHPWVRNADGSITIGEAAGHTHTILDGNDSVVSRADSQIDRHHSITEGGHMDTEEQLRSLKTQLAEAAAKVASLESDVSKQTMRADGAEQKLDVANTTIADLQAQIAAAATVIETEAIKREAMRADEAERKVAEFDAKFADAVKARVALERKAAVVLGDLRMDGMSEDEIRQAGIKHLDKKTNVTSLNPAQLEARFDALYDLHAANARSQQRLGDIITAQNEQRNDELEKRREEWRNQGTAPLPSSRLAQKGI